MNSFEEATDTAMLNRQPQRLRIKKASKSGDLRSTLLSLGANEQDLDDLAILNGRELSDRIAVGTRIKTVGD